MHFYWLIYNIWKDNFQSFTTTFQPFTLQFGVTEKIHEYISHERFSIQLRIFPHKKMIENIEIFVEEIEETNIKWLQRVYVKKHFENLKFWTSAHDASWMSTRTSTRSINWCREDVNDVKGSLQHEVNKPLTQGKFLKGLNQKTGIFHEECVSSSCSSVGWCSMIQQSSSETLSQSP